MDLEFLDKIQVHKDERSIQAEKARDQLLDVTLSKGIKNQVATSNRDSQQVLLHAIGVLIRAIKEHEPAVEVKNPVSMAGVTEALEKLQQTIDEKETDFSSIQTGLESLSLAIQSMPTPADYTEQFAALKKSFDNRKAPQVTVEPPKVEVAPPQVNVEAPQVNVKAPDLKPLEDAIKETKKPTKFDLTTYRAQDIDEMEQGIQYIGFTNLDGYWYILKSIQKDNSIRYKFGKNDYSTAWGLASTFRYKLLEEAIRSIK